MTQSTGNPLDLRAWLDAARKLGELKDVRGADWNLELGAISELNVKIDSAPALLFDDIKGYAPGFRVLTCSTASPARLSSLLRLGVEGTHAGLVHKLRGRPKAVSVKERLTIRVEGGGEREVPLTGGRAPNDCCNCSSPTRMVWSNTSTSAAPECFLMSACTSRS